MTEYEIRTEFDSIGKIRVLVISIGGFTEGLTIFQYWDF